MNVKDILHLPASVAGDSQQPARSASAAKPVDLELMLSMASQQRGVTLSESERQDAMQIVVSRLTSADQNRVAAAPKSESRDIFKRNGVLAVRKTPLLPPPVADHPLVRIPAPFDYPVLYISPCNAFRPLPLLDNENIPFAADRENHKELNEKRVSFRRYFRHLWSFHGAYGRAGNTTIGDWDAYVLQTFIDCVDEIIDYLSKGGCDDRDDVACEVEFRRRWINIIITECNAKAGYPVADFFSRRGASAVGGLAETEAPRPAVKMSRSAKRKLARPDGVGEF